MKLDKTKGKLLAALAAGALLVAPAASAQNRDHDHRHRLHDDDDHTAAGVIAGVAIAGVLAAAIASKKKSERERERRYFDDRYYHRNGWDNAFRPEGAGDVWCYREERSCFRNGHYSSRWTDHEFGYDRRI